MFIVGLGLGALVTIVLADVLFRYFSPLLSGVMLVLFVIFCAFFTVFPGELRIGLVPGILLGTLLFFSPHILGEEPAQAEMV